MPVNVTARKKNAARPAWKVADAYRQFLRGRPCYLDGHRAGGCGLADPPRRTPIEAAHVGGTGTAGMGTKAADAYCIPLCQRHHDEQHGKIGTFSQRGGWATFQLKYGFNAVQVAGEYWRVWKGDKGELGNG